MKKVLSLMITLAMITTMLLTVSFPAAAAWQDSITATQPAAYTGSEGEGYLITTPAEFMWLKSNPNATAYLGADIQIGEAANPFTAPFAYNGKLIGINADDLYTITAYVSTNTGYTGLFKNITAGAVVKNIELSGAVVTTLKTNDAQYVGALTGAVQGALVENVVNKAAVSGYILVGGIAGKIENSGSSIGRVINCKNYGNVVSTTHYAAGITGALESGKIINCANFGTLTASQSYAAGLAGRINGGTIYNSYNAGAVTCGAYPGGIAGVPIGVNANDMPAIINCFNVGTITATGGQVGGILGLPNSGLTKVYGCYNMGVLSGNKIYPIAGNGATGTTATIDLKNNRYIGNVTYTGDNGATKFETITANDVAGWTTPDASANLLNGYPLSNWTKTNVKYPQLTTNMFPADYDAPVDEVKIDYGYGEGIEIKSEADFKALQSNPTAIAYLTEDITLGSKTAPITPFEFKGKFIGVNGMRKVTAYVKGSANIGLFNYLRNAEVRNIELLGEITSTGEYAGGFAGRMINSRIENVINRATVTSGSNFAGGIAARIGDVEGQVDNSVIINAKNYGNVNSGGHYGSGIVGFMVSGKIINSANLGAVTGTGSYSTGVVGRMDGGAVYNCYNAGNVTCGASAAGIAALPIGYVEGDAPYVFNCFNVGTITATAGQAGGIYSWPNKDKAYIYGNYNAGKIVGSSKSYPIVAKGDAVSGALIDMADNRYFGKNTYTGTNGATELTAQNLADWKITADVTGKILSGYPVSDWTIVSGVKYPQLATNLFPTDIELPEEEENYTGEYGEGIVIDSAEDFLALANNINAVAYLTKDIQLGTADAMRTSNFGFNGKLIGVKNSEGNYPTITIYLNKASANGGLFENLTSGAVIKDIIIRGSVSNSGGTIGALAANLKGGKIINVTNYATVNGAGNLAGGVVGVVLENGIIANTYNYGSVTNTAHYAAGIAGAIDSGKVINCANHGTIVGGTTADGAYCGGIAGRFNSGIIYNSYNTGDVSARYYPGGIAGCPLNYNDSNPPVIVNCYNTGKITATNCNYRYSSSGILGTSLSKAMKVYGCYNAGEIVNLSNDAKKHPIVGSNTNASETSADMKQNRYLVNSTAYTSTNNATSYTEVTASDVAGWNLTDENTTAIASYIVNEYPLSTWRFNEKLNIPELTENPVIVVENGTAEAPYLITSKEDFMKIKDNNTAYYKLVKDINLGSYEPFEFKGSLTADNMKTITVDINLPEAENVGLFSVLTDATEVSNIRVAGKITGNINVGGIAGKIHNTVNKTYSKALISNCENTAEVTAITKYPGGIVGHIEFESAVTVGITTISECVNKGAVKLDYDKGEVGAGGIVGGNIPGISTIERCYNYGSVTGSRRSGQTSGIAAYTNGNINFCVNYGTIKGTTRVAGISGHQQGRAIQHSYNLGTIIGDGDAIGGIAGFLVASGKIMFCYNAGNIYNYDDTYPAGSIVGTVSAMYPTASVNYIQGSYNVGTIYNHCDATPVHSLYGMFDPKYDHVVPEIDSQVVGGNPVCSATLGSETNSANYTKNLADMKNHVTAYFAKSTTAYPFAQISLAYPNKNNQAINHFAADVEVIGNGKVNIADGSYISDMGEVVIILKADEGNEFDVLTINGNSVTPEAVYNDDGELSYYVAKLAEVKADIAVSVSFKELKTIDSETIQAKVNTYEVTYFRPIILQNEIINKGTENEIELVRGTNYAIIMSQAESFEGYELVDFGVKNEDNYLTAKPYITEDGEFGTLLYGNKIYSGNKLTFKPYIKLKNVLTGEETYFEGNAAEITIR